MVSVTGSTLRQRLLAALIGWFLLGATGHVLAQSDAEEAIDGSTYDSEYTSVRVPAPYRLGSERDRPRNYVIPQVISLILPGFDQWYEGQYVYGAAYTGAGVLGVGLAAASYDASREEAQRNADRRSRGQQEVSDLDAEGNGMRSYMLGNLLYQGAGGMSAYHSFRSALPTRQLQGEFKFIKRNETPEEVLLAPFQFEHLTKTTTLAPLGIALALHLMTTMTDIEGIKHDSLTGSDIAYATAFSYNAGVHEEAVFRGWVMPVMMQWMGSEFWSNTTTAGLFALAHINNISVPWPQLALGWYMGYLTQQNKWSISEAVFIHAWWDVFAFLTEYQITRIENKIGAVQPTLWLPPLELHF